jgi:hypothetical protein
MQKEKMSNDHSAPMNSMEEGNKKKLKKELMELFQKNGYLSEGKDYEVTFRTTSGNIAWISINSIETIK